MLFTLYVNIAMKAAKIQQGEALTHAHSCGEGGGGWGSGVDWTRNAKTG